MHRRRFLAALIAGALPPSGCLDDGSPRSPTPPGSSSPSPPPTSTAPETESTPTPTLPIETSTFTPTESTSLPLGEPFTTEDRTTVTVGGPRVRKMILTFGVHTDVAAVAGAQFLVVDVAVGGSRRPASDLRLAFEADGVRAPVADAAGRYVVHEPERAGTQLGFAIPHDPTPGSVAVVWSRDGAADVRWTAGEETLARLGRAPVFEVRSFEVPGEVERGTAFEASVTVANTGDRDGRFLAELGSNLVSDQDEIVVEVPQGETVTRRETLDPHVPDGTTDLPVVLRWGEGSLERTVNLV